MNFTDQTFSRFEALLAMPDPPDLIGVLPFAEPRGHRVVYPGDPDRALTIWLPLAWQWMQARVFDREECS